MAFELACQCGKRFRAEDSLAGETIPCPSCGQTMRRVSAAPLAAPAAPAAPAAAGDRITVTCTCGGRFAADPALAGRRVRCPKCGNVLTVPAQVESAYALTLDDDPLGNLDALVAASDPLMGTPRQGPSRRAPASSINPMVLVGIFGGGGVVVFLVIVLAVMFSGGGSRQSGDVASAPVAAPWLENSPAPAPAVPSSPPVNRPPAQGSPAPSDAPNPFETVQPAPGDANSGSGDSDPRPAVPSRTAGKFDEALARWHVAEGAIQGARKVDDEEVVVLHYSWMSALLPQLGYGEVYSKFNFKESWTVNPNLTLSTAIIPEFLNPADDRDRFAGSPFDKMGLTHFVGMSGVEDARNVVAAELPRTDPRAGVFGYDQVVRRDQIKDGSSQTIMIVGSGELTGPWVAGGGATVRGARAPYFDKLSGLGTRGPRAGTMAMFADGATRFIPEDIDPRVFAAMCTVGGSESVDLGTLAPPEPRYPTKEGMKR